MGAVEFDPVAEGLIEDGRARRGSRLRSRELWASAADGGVFLVDRRRHCCSSAIRRRTASPLLVLVLVGAYALAYNVEFEVGPGLAVATELVFVPMLFLLPLELVPLCVAAGVMLGNVVELAEGRDQARTVLGRFGEASYSLGPVLVLAAAGVTAADRGGAVGPAASHSPRSSPSTSCTRRRTRGSPSGSRRASSSATSRSHGPSMRRWRRSGTWPRLAAADHAAASCSCCRSSRLLRTFARERRARVDHALELSHAYRGTALLLGDVVEADDSYTGSHSRDVVSLRSPSRTSSGSTRAPGATPSSWRCCTTSARSGSRTRSSTSPAR